MKRLCYDHSKNELWYSVILEEDKWNLIFGTKPIFLNIVKFFELYEKVKKLPLINKMIYNLFKDNSIWNGIMGDDFKYNAQTIYQKLHENKYICSHNYKVGVRKFKCTNTPVYHNTICLLCSKNVKMCDSCFGYEFNDNRVMCNMCDSFTGICKSCDDEDTTVLKFITCKSCNNSCCHKHYPDIGGKYDEICTNCYDNTVPLETETTVKRRKILIRSNATVSSVGI